MKFNKIFVATALMITSALAIASNGGDDAGNGGINYLARAGVYQYTCVTYAWGNNSKGEIVRTDSAKNYLNYLGDSLPSPVLDTRFYKCHDDAKYGAVDSFEYPRLELIPNAFSLFSRFDTRFGTSSSGKKVIDSLVDARMNEEFNIQTQSDLFKMFSMTSNSYGYVLKTFVNSKTNEYFCPSSKYNEFPYVKIVTDYTGDTEGLYLGEFEGKTLNTPSGVALILPTILVSESKLMKYGFFLRDGEKYRVSLESLIETDTVMFYYPFSDSQDPLIKGDRKIVVIRPIKSSVTKKIGCIFKNVK